MEGIVRWGHFKNNFTVSKYLHFLQHDLLTALSALYPNHNDYNSPIEEILQQDGLIPYYTREVRY